MSELKSYEFRVPPIILTGAGCSKRVGEVARELGGARALMVTDKVVRGAGYVDQVRPSLQASGVESEVFDGVPTEPEMGYVEEAFKAYKAGDCDMVVGLGGGSPMDTAKALAILATSGGSLRDYEGAEKVPRPRAKLILIPTTGGTGSELSMFTIITDVERRRKMLIKSRFIVPDAAICDPLFTLSVPPGLTMGTGLDALTHAIEAYVSVRAQPITDLIAPQAIRLISENLRQAWADGSNLDARAKVMLGATMAAMCFSNASVALVHGMSRPIGAYFHLPHGLSNAILLPTVMEFSYIGNPWKYAQIAEAMGEKVEGLPLVEAARRSVEAIKRLCRDLDVPTLQGAGCEPSKVLELARTMAEDAIASGSPANNPRKATVDQIAELYKKTI